MRSTVHRPSTGRHSCGRWTSTSPSCERRARSIPKKPNERGASGEAAACRFLLAEGYTILERNFRCRFGEIDIIAEKGNYLCFEEVKTRGPRAIAAPAEWVTVEKQKKILRTAEIYLAGRGRRYRGRCQPRFDCIEVYADRDGNPVKIRHLINAF
ncbi:MAG: YraN family protein [Acutalibacteraceae bacterium]|nr:YraN family protein [Acutalibacteraceae bacterium]